MDLPEIESKISELEKKKAELIEHIRQLNRRLRYKQYEHKALEPFVERTRDVYVGSIRKQKSAIEFKIATEAYTPRMEREWLKEAKKIDDRLAEVREIEWARRKIKLVEGDITECNQGIVGIEEQLKTIREELKRLYDDVHAQRAAAKRAVKFAPPEDQMVTLGDIGIIEQEGKSG